MNNQRDWLLIAFLMDLGLFEKECSLLTLEELNESEELPEDIGLIDFSHAGAISGAVCVSPKMPEILINYPRYEEDEEMKRVLFTGAIVTFLFRSGCSESHTQVMVLNNHDACMPSKPGRKRSHTCTSGTPNNVRSQCYAARFHKKMKAWREPRTSKERV